MTVVPAGYQVDDLNQLAIASDQSVSHPIEMVFAKFDEFGSARQVFLWWKQEGLKYVRRLELRSHPVVWVEPRYGMILRTLHNPIYAGVYVFGRSKTTANRDRKRLLRCLIEEVQFTTEAKRYLVRIVWKGGALTEREVVRRPAGVATKTSEDIIEQRRWRINVESATCGRQVEMFDTNGGEG